MISDRRLPGIYIDVEDRSLVQDTLDNGRSGLVVLLSDRGDHNKVVELNSRNDLYDKYGRPDFIKYGQGHYLAEKFLSYSSKLYVVRPALMESENPDNCMAISNTIVKIGDETINREDVDGTFSFTEGSNNIDYDSTQVLAIGDWICIKDHYNLYFQVIGVDEENYRITIDKIFPKVSISSSIQKVFFIELDYQEDVRSLDDFDIQASDVGWFFYAIGAGEYYNSIFIRGTRNTELEKMYTNDDGVPLYPNMFMDVTIYRYNDDSTVSILEGPFPVSLIDRLPGGQIIKDTFTGEQLYLPIVINKRSKIINCLEGLGSSKLLTIGSQITYPYEPDNNRRLIVQTLFANGKLLGLPNVGIGGLRLQNGKNGNLFDSNGRLNFSSNDEYNGLVAQAYSGTLKSVDGSVELLSQSIYPTFVFDYVLCGGYTVDICNAARELVDNRGDCLLLSDTGAINNTPDADLESRRTQVSWNTYNVGLYVTYREIFDSNTGKRFFITPVYHAIERHLYVDGNYWLTEPVAGIEKGAISDSIKLIYSSNLTKLGDLVENELNPVIVEPDGVYILTQFSCWKRLSIMKRLHAVKFIHYIKKEIPKILKDILQRKATAYWINQCNLRINGLMNKFVENSTNDKYAILKSYSAIINFDDLRPEINVTLSLNFIRTIEKINVSILTY